MSSLHLVRPTYPKLKSIQDAIMGYWQNDVWNLNDHQFDNFRKTLWDKTYRKIVFTHFKSHSIRNEVKFFVLKRLGTQDVRLYHTAIKVYANSFRHMADFINTYYPGIHSFVEMDLKRARLQLRSFLINRGLRVGTTRLPRQESALIQIHGFITDYYDDREEFEKDIWDFRRIPGTRFPEHESHYILDFQDVPFPFRELVKRYLRVRATTCSHGQCNTDVRILRTFLKNVLSQNPTWRELTLLSRRDMEGFLAVFRSQSNRNPKTQRDYLISLHGFLEYIQRAEAKEAPWQPINLIFFKEDLPRPPAKSDDCIKYIPEGVLRQLEDNLEYLSPPEYIPVVILLRATGWRISDILNLRYDNCLVHTAQGWYLCGDILKTQVLNHRVPITDEVAQVVQTVAEQTRKISTPDNNPKRFLFVRTCGKRKGRPPESRCVRMYLNRLAQALNIVDDEGNLFHFKNHAFRHTKGVELINNGMNILHVQKWLAHASPEMTLQYARILDTTMRKAWEEMVNNGVFRLDSTGKPVKVEIKNLANEDEIEWEYIRSNLDAVKIPLGYCFKSKKVDCRQQLNPCLTCRSFCTIPAFIPQFESEMREIKAVIERGMTQGQVVWVDKNQALLDKYEAILAVLKDGRIHYQAGKSAREYIGEERINAK